LKLDDLTDGPMGIDLFHHNAIFFKHRRTMLEIYDLIDRGLYERAHEAWEEIPHSDQTVLNIPRSKGGFFNPQERSIAVRGVDKASGWSVWNERVSETAQDRL